MSAIYDVGYEVKRLHMDTGSDFTALALPSREDRRLRWLIIEGGRNERLKHMVVKSGKGLAGSALLRGRTAHLEEGHPQLARLRTECPVMLAEQLFAALAVPVSLPSGGRGVLLTGSRSPRTYTARETGLLQEAAGSIAAAWSFRSMGAPNS